MSIKIPPENEVYTTVYIIMQVKSKSCFYQGCLFSGNAGKENGADLQNLGARTAACFSEISDGEILSSIIA